MPEANGRWTDEAILVEQRIDIGIGTALEGRGLVVPVIRDARPSRSRGHRARRLAIWSRRRGKTG